MVNIIVTILAAIAGCLMCFEGYKLFRLSLGIAGALAGFIIAKVLIELTADTIKWSDSGKTIFIVLFAAGLGICAFSLYMKALIIITTLVCAFWFYDDFSFLFSKIANPVLRVVITCAAGLIAGLLLGVIVYYAQKWTICLFTAYAGAKIISGVMLPLIWSAVSSGEYVGLFEQKVIGADIGINYTLVRTLLLVAFCAAGFVIQLKTSKK